MPVLKVLPGRVHRVMSRKMTGVTLTRIIITPMVIICLPLGVMWRARRISATSTNMPSRKDTATPISRQIHSGRSVHSSDAQVTTKVPTVAINPCAKLVVAVVRKMSTMPIVTSA